MTRSAHYRLACIVLISMCSLLAQANRGVAQQQSPCTVAECAQQAVDAAARAEAAVKTLQDQLNKLQADIKKLQTWGPGGPTPGTPGTVCPPGSYMVGISDIADVQKVLVLCRKLNIEQPP
jgi:hypothetical protein